MLLCLIETFIFDGDLTNVNANGYRVTFSSFKGTEFLKRSDGHFPSEGIDFVEFSFTIALGVRSRSLLA